MEAKKCLDNQQSTEIEAALKRFEDVCNSLEDQHTKLLDLENRRKKLNDALQSLRNEIEEENNYFRAVMNDKGGDVLDCADNEGFLAMVEPATPDTVAIKKFIQKQKLELTSPEREMGLDCLKGKLEKHTNSCFEGVGYRSKYAVQSIHQHVEEEKCVISELRNQNIEVENTDFVDLYNRHYRHFPESVKGQLSGWGANNNTN